MNISPGPVAPVSSIPSRQLIFGFPGVLQVQSPTARLYIVDATASIKSVQASVGTQPQGSAVIIDLLKNGITMYTTAANRPAIAPNTNVVVATLPDIVAVVLGDYLQVRIVQVGSSITGSDLTAQVVTG